MPECIKCGKKPEDIPEYVVSAKDAEMTPEQYVKSEEGTYNSKTDKFACTICYLAMGAPSSPTGWKAGDPISGSNPLMTALEKAAYQEDDFDPPKELGISDAHMLEFLHEIVSSVLSTAQKQGDSVAITGEDLMFLAAAGFMTGVEFQKGRDQ